MFTLVPAKVSFFVDVMCECLSMQFSECIDYIVHDWGCDYHMLTLIRLEGTRLDKPLLFHLRNKLKHGLQPGRGIIGGIGHLKE